MRRRVWLTYVVTVEDADSDLDAEQIAQEVVSGRYSSPDSVEIERPDETKQRKAWAL